MMTTSSSPTQKLLKDVIHEVLEASRSIGGTLGTDEVLVVALPTSEGSLPLIPLPDPHLVIGVAKVDLREDLRKVEAVQHFRYEGEGETILNRDLVETTVVDHQAELAIRLREEHHWSRSRGLRRPDEAVCRVVPDVSFHLRQFWG